ncbi:MAG: hypothetical protein JXA20_10690 [Spirochaetes bacterium]|nr:hypothetical protein [Spirochaetota bacterium]
MKTPRTAIVVLMILLAAGSLPAGTQEKNAPAVRATVKPATATIGDVLEYRVNIAGKNIGGVNILLPERRVAYPEKGKAAVPAAPPGGEPEEEDPGESVPLYIIHKAVKDDRSEKEITDITVILQMSYYRPGRHTLPEVEIRDTDKAAIGYKVPEITIKSLNEKGEFQEIEPPLRLSGNYTRLILLIAGLIVLAVAGVFLYRRIRRVMEERRAAIPAVPPIELFWKEMAGLDPRGLIAGGAVEEYVFGISMVFRRFLSRQYRFDAVEMTSDEILSAMKRILHRERLKRYADDIGKCFNLWDLSKFAEFSPTAETLTMNLELLEKLAETMARDEGYGTDRV